MNIHVKYVQWLAEQIIQLIPQLFQINRNDGDRFKNLYVAFLCLWAAGGSTACKWHNTYDIYLFIYYDTYDIVWKMRGLIMEQKNLERIRYVTAWVPLFPSCTSLRKLSLLSLSFLMWNLSIKIPISQHCCKAFHVTGIWQSVAIFWSNLHFIRKKIMSQKDWDLMEI